MLPIGLLEDLGMFMPLEQRQQEHWPAGTVFCGTVPSLDRTSSKATPTQKKIPLTVIASTSSTVGFHFCIIQTRTLGRNKKGAKEMKVESQQ
jgi:hypothetical protein